MRTVVIIGVIALISGALWLSQRETEDPEVDLTGKSSDLLHLKRLESHLRRLIQRGLHLRFFYHQSLLL